MTELFPVQNDASCAAKWSYLSFHLHVDRFNMCCRAGNYHFRDMPEGAKFGDFNLHPKLQADRAGMLEGKWPDNGNVGCAYCKRVEDAGGYSERHFYNERAEWNPAEIKRTGQITNDVTPTVVEVYFRNTCNMSCTYCSPVFSSQIEAEVRKHGAPIEGYGALGNQFHRSDIYNKRRAEFWEWMSEHAHKVRWFQVLGGEPFYQKTEFEETLQFFESDNVDTSGLEIRITSNLKHDPVKFKEKMDRIGDILDAGKAKRWDIVCSIDAWGPKQEYARNGLDLVQWEENFNTLMASKCAVSVHSTLCVLTLPTAYELRKKTLRYERAYSKKIQHQWNMLQNPAFFAPASFGHYTLPDLTKLIGLVTTDQRSILEGFRKEIEAASPDLKQMQDFITYSDNIDKRRNQDWRSIFPDLAQYVEGLLNE